MDIFVQYPATKPRIGLSFGIEKVILTKVNEAQELTDTLFKEIVVEAYSLIHPLELVKSLEEHLVARVLTRIEDLQKQEEKKAASRTPRKTFGSGYIEWISALDSQNTCLYLANYDIEKALHYYWVEDYLLVQEAVQAKSGHESQITLTRLEACMYGFGGKYSDDNGNDPNTVNIDDANPEDIQAFMSGFGF